MNLDALTTPFSDDAPCGDDLSFSSEFDTIQELRRADDPSLDQGEWVTALKLADWPAVRAHCLTLLGQRSKDLRVAAWLTDAETRLHGYKGLADGLTLCRLLCERYWTTLHPQLDADGDAEQRSGNLRWLLNQIAHLVPTLPVLSGGEQSYSLRDIDAARPTGAGAERSGDGAAPEARPVAVAPEDIAAARRNTPHAALALTLTEARRAQQALEQLQQLLDARLGNEGPAFAPAKAVLTDAIHEIDRLAREAAPQGAGGETLSDPAGGPTTHLAAPAAGTPVGTPRSRPDALRQLRTVAEFFRRTEPHSPVAYLAERAAQWGEMPLHAWLRAVVKDPSTLSQVEELLGVEAPRIGE